MEAIKQIRMDYPDEDVRSRVSRFLNSRYFPAFRYLDITVEHGAVTLTGEVQSYYEKQVAMTSCQHVVGVLSLKDAISVRGEIDTSATELSKVVK